MRTEQFRALSYKAWTPSQGMESREPDNTGNRDELILRYTPLITSVAYQLIKRLPPHILVEDLISAGIVGLIDALNKFDPEKKVQFRTYAQIRIRGAMLDELRSLDWVCRSVRERSKQLEKIYQHREKEQGRPPEAEELARDMNIPLEEFYELMRKAKEFLLVNIDDLGENIRKPPNDRGDLWPGSEGDGDNPHFLLSLAEMRGVLAAGIEELTAIERNVVSLYYYESLNFKEIGEVMGVSASRVCQINTRAILKLRGKIRSYLQGSAEMQPEKA